ncbi:MAG: response regulator [Kiritimatiellia bacterium]
MKPPPPSGPVRARAGFRILVIDDDEDLCQLTADYLEPLGFDVQSEQSGETGAARAAAEPWHAVILDVMLPDIDGFEVLRRIRRASKVPVLMLTGRGEEVDRVVDSSWERTTTCPRPSPPANCWRASAPCCAGRDGPRRSGRRNLSARWSPARCASTRTPARRRWATIPSP